MTLPGLLFANLFRHRTRTTLTLLSLMVAFLLFILMFLVTMVQLRLGRERSGA